MNDFIKAFFVVFIVFIVALVLNSIDRLGAPFLMNVTALTNNWIGMMPYALLIFLGLFYLLRRN